MPSRSPTIKCYLPCVVEDMVTKSFVGGTLTSLQPSTDKEEKGSTQTAVEVKVAGAALGEIVTFVKAVENAGCA